MTPTEMAKKLVVRFLPYLSNLSIISNPGEPVKAVMEDGQKYGRAIQCALIVCESMTHYMPSINGRPPNYHEENEYCLEFWEKVKNVLNEHTFTPLVSDPVCVHSMAYKDDKTLKVVCPVCDVMREQPDC